MRSAPFSTERHASPEMFFGYSGASSRPPGGWNLEEIIGCWQQWADGPPSFWAIGERKLGKTSLLVRLEDLLNAQRGEAPRRPVPLLLRCKEIANIPAFYRELFKRAALADREQALNRDELTLLTDGNGPLTAVELFDRVIADLGTLVAQFSPEGSPRARLVLLIDDVGDAIKNGWAMTLFEQLRALLRGHPGSDSDAALRRDDVAVVIAAERSIERADGARSLLDLVEELPLHTLDLNEVAKLIGDSFKRLRRSSWPRRIYTATAGHPWLVHFVMEKLGASIENDVQEQEPDLNAIVKTQFRVYKDGVAIFLEYLEGLMDRSVELLSHLALEGSTVDALAAKTKLSAAAVAKRLEQMLNLGIVYQTPGDATDAQCRYFLGDIFKQWFLAHTGSGVLLNEIDRLRAPVTSAQLAVLKAPFTLTLGTDPDFVLVDGLSTRLVPVGPRFPQNLRNMNALIRNEGKEDLDLVADELKEALRQSNWEAVWNDYVDHAGVDARFVLRVANPDLFQFPIELLPINGRPLALERPVYKELMAGQRGPAYRLCSNLLSPETELNVLLIGSGREGAYEGRHYDSLGLVATEIAEVAALLRAKSTSRRLKIGRVVAVVEPEVNLPKGVERLPLSIANAAKALRGELDVPVPFHLLHYCGHYIHNRDESPGGFLLHDGESLKLFNLAEWYHTLNQETPLRLVCLNACDSAGHRQDPNFYHLGAAREALQCGVPVVIGMRWNIRDSRALEFSRTFYPELLECGVPEVALFKTRRSLNKKEPGSSLWAAPVMLTR